MSPEIHYTSEEHEYSIAKCIEDVEIMHKTVTVKSGQADTLGETLATNTVKTIEKCTGLDKCGVKKSHHSGANFHWDRCPLLPIVKGK
ncbi:MAG: hypothetical protein D3903_07040 [Candidatus Electrothrix sp. GM3_4]|nr:hypothetical protein [Candidatus Electrothrix sp. GM3_4]